MNEINFNPETKLNIQKDSSKISKYDNMKKAYKGFIQKMENSDFANSLTRYQIELNMLQDLKQYALELDFINERYQILTEKFAQFGIKPKQI